MTTCPSDDVLGALSRGELASEEATRVRSHADGCPSCYAQLLRGDRHDTSEGKTGKVDAPRWAEPSGTQLDWQPGRDLGRYVVLLTLGKGGMGVVFRAYDKELDRAVALKVLHQSGDDGSSGGPTRLLREAQAMARLSHPNVVAVHDVVVLEGRVCVVMELVEGVTVREWLRAEPRPHWREILRVFRAAGEGLAAAHEAKLVHRDFKPDNVLVARDGRVRVTDFGIARLAGDETLETRTPSGGLPLEPAPTAEARAAAVPEAIAASPGVEPTISSPTQLVGATLAVPITREGQVVGTPRYMAPEQFAKARADFRTDQFSFAVALYEAMYGRLPFAGSTTALRLEHAQRDQVQPPPSSTNVPAWVHRTLLRALAADPAKRYPSMGELTAALARDPSKQRNRLLVGAGVATAVVLASVAAVRSTQARAQLCTGSERKLVGLWDPERREQIERAFAATGLVYASDTFSRAAAALDRYTAQWVTTHREACEATSVHGEQSAQVLTLRMSCLDTRLKAVSTLTELFTRADAKMVGSAKQSLDALPAIATCSDVARLTAKVPPPDDPGVAAEVERIRGALARAEVLSGVGQAAEAQLIARTALTDAEKTGHTPVIAEAKLTWGGTLARSGKYGDAEAVHFSAFALALGAGHEDVVTRAALRLSGNAYRQNKNQRGLEWAELAEAANLRTQDAESAVMLLNARGNIARNVGDFATAADYYRRAFEQSLEKLGEEHMTTVGVRYNIASALQNLGRFREAAVEFAAVIETARRTLGPKHPFLGYPLVGSLNVASFRGDDEAAERGCEEVLALTGGKGVNADHAFVALADLAKERGRYDEALALIEQAFQVEKSLDRGVLAELNRLGKRGEVFLARGDDPRARQSFEEVISRGAKLEGAFDAVSAARTGLARLLLREGKPARALGFAEAAVGTLTRVRGGRHPYTLDARLLAADARWALGQQSAALAAVEAALADARIELDESHRMVVRAKALLARGEARALSNP